MHIADAHQIEDQLPSPFFLIHVRLVSYALAGTHRLNMLFVRFENRMEHEKLHGLVRHRWRGCNYNAEELA